MFRQSLLFSIWTTLACGTNSGTTEAPSNAETTDNTVQASPADVGDVLATVNGSAVGSTDFEQAAARSVPSNGQSLSIDEKKEVLDDLINDELLYQEALKRGFDRDPKVKKVMVNALLREDVYGAVRNSDFTDSELEAYYQSHLEEFIVPEKVQIYRLLVKVKDDRPDADAKAKAERLHSELKSDVTKFKDLASQESDGPFRRRGGDVGFVPKTGKPGLDEMVVSKAFTMSLEELSEPFKSEDGYNIIYIANRRESVERSFQQMKGAVLRKVKSEKLAEQYETYTSGLRSGATITVDDSTLDGINVKPSARPRLGMPGSDLQLNSMGDKPGSGE
ncbi:MAG: peptidylprolyl isomerase [Myxococcota bacterium]|nr:peptidylprolyl isomerase [Myxococcota bacterium]